MVHVAGVAESYLDFNLLGICDKAYTAAGSILGKACNAGIYSVDDLKRQAVEDIACGDGKARDLYGSFENI